MCDKAKEFEQKCLHLCISLTIILIIVGIIIDELQIVEQLAMDSLDDCLGFRFAGVAWPFGKLFSKNAL